ncbi:MAG: TRL-like family protein [Burkholderiaceae bacterium]|jgi:hypothetical protein
MALYRSLATAALCLAASGITGCANTGIQSQTGAALFFQSNAEAVTATGLPTGPKRGVSCSKNYLGAATLGDASIEAAKRSAGIATVTTVDRYYHRILGFYGELCTVVTGH